MLQENTESVLEGQNQQQNCKRKCRKTLHTNTLDNAEEAETTWAHLLDERLAK